MYCRIADSDKDDVNFAKLLLQEKKLIANKKEKKKEVNMR
jgi:hypothetical protein